MSEGEIVWALHLDTITDCCGAWVYEFPDGKKICSCCHGEIKNE